MHGDPGPGRVRAGSFFLGLEYERATGSRRVRVVETTPAPPEHSFGGLS
jgi:hypothetical protein